MKIVIASGKGGTGKTFVATNLARTLRGAALADTDVEAANAHLFLRPEGTVAEAVTVDVPEIDTAACTRCGACAAACRFNALAAIGKSGVMVFRELCHSCGVCEAVCPAKAVRMVPHEVGRRRRGTFLDGRAFADGELLVGQVRTPAVIAAVKESIAGEELQVWDGPPGTGCAVREAIAGADLCLLVTEATPFGMSDLARAVELVGALGVPSAVVLNRAGLGGEDVAGFCRERGIPLAAEIPFSRAVAEAYSHGRLAVEDDAGVRAIFAKLADDVLGGRFATTLPASPAVRKRADKSGDTPVAPAADVSGAPLRRFVIVSGKGGTGKTMLASSLAVVAGAAGQVSLADCDVDAANLHLVVRPTVSHVEVFASGFVAEIDAARCAGCGECARACRFGAITMTPRAVVDPLKCEGCGLCEIVCPLGIAGEPNPVALWPALSGELVRGASTCGPFTGGRLWAGGEASGKLVAAVRGAADAAAAAHRLDDVLIDGPPGTGCPVNASITGTDLAVAVTEPTPSGQHDLGRILDLLRFFGVPSVAVINKADLNADAAELITAECAARGVEVVGRIPFDRAIVEALADGRPATDVAGAAGKAVRETCERIWATAAKTAAPHK